MGYSLAVLVFFATLGVLIFLYALHFRRRAFILGPDRLWSALSRALEGEENRSQEELEEAARELEARFGRAVLFSWVLLALNLGACLILTFFTIQPAPALALCGPAVFLLSSALSLELLRELPRTLLKGGRDRNQ
ncbi:hypothetical protein [Candidatus Solincola sp.]|nr:hypothetical protein [Actinomycetota bacterium]